MMNIFCHKYFNLIIAYFYAFLFLLLFRPYFTWTNAIPAYAAIILSLVYVGKITINRTKVYSTFFLFLVLSYLYMRNFSISSIISFSCIIFYLIPQSKFNLIFDRFKSVFAFTLIVSISLYILVVFFDIDFDFNTIKPWNEVKSYMYKQYPLLVIPNKIGDPILKFRLHSMFEEPGVLGTMNILLLYSSNLNFKDWRICIFVLSGLLSFSLYFYIIFLFLYVYVKGIKLKNLFVVSSVAISVFIFLIPNIENKDFDLSALVYNRFSTTDASRTFNGDNRSSMRFDDAYSKFCNNSDFITILIGAGNNAHSLIDPGIQTYKMFIYDYGFIYILLLFFFIMFHLFTFPKPISSSSLFYLLLILSFLYQRPSDMFIPGFFMLLFVAPRYKYMIT